MFYVYIIQNLKDYKLYIGYSANLRNRILEHRKGCVKTTKNKRPLMLIYYEGYRSDKDARVREKFLKSGKGREFINKNIIHSRVSAPGGPA
jgi:putative endonuclease